MSETRTSARIQGLRNRELAADEVKLIDDVGEYGCHIIHVTAGLFLPGWSYTIGLYDSFRQPEIVVIGLKTDTAQSLLNEMQQRIRSGLLILEGLRQSDLLGDVDCEFREVSQRPELA